MMRIHARMSSFAIVPVCTMAVINSSYNVTVPDLFRIAMLIPWDYVL